MPAGRRVGLVYAAQPAQDPEADRRAESHRVLLYYCSVLYGFPDNLSMSFQERLRLTQETQGRLTREMCTELVNIRLRQNLGR
jgi:hypothetical protein